MLDKLLYKVYNDYSEKSLKVGEKKWKQKK